MNDYIALIDDFKHQFSPNIEEFKQKSSQNRSGNIGEFKYQFHGTGCRLVSDQGKYGRKNDINAFGKNFIILFYEI